MGRIKKTTDKVKSVIMTVRVTRELLDWFHRGAKHTGDETVSALVIRAVKKELKARKFKEPPPER